MRESFLERKLIDAVKQIGGKAVKWVAPGSRGVPDRIIILPDGQTAFVEMKAPRKPLGPLQKKWANDLRKLGHKVYKIDSVVDIEAFIADCKGGDAK